MMRKQATKADLIQNTDQAPGRTGVYCGHQFAHGQRGASGAYRPGEDADERINYAALPVSDINALFSDFDSTSNWPGNTLKDKNTCLAVVGKGGDEILAALTSHIDLSGAASVTTLPVLVNLGWVFPPYNQCRN